MVSSVRNRAFSQTIPNAGSVGSHSSHNTTQHCVGGKWKVTGKLLGRLFFPELWRHRRWCPPTLSKAMSTAIQRQKWAQLPPDLAIPCFRGSTRWSLSGWRPGVWGPSASMFPVSDDQGTSDPALVKTASYSWLSWVRTAPTWGLWRRVGRGYSTHLGDRRGHGDWVRTHKPVLTSLYMAVLLKCLSVFPCELVGDECCKGFLHNASTILCFLWWI